MAIYRDLVNFTHITKAFNMQKSNLEKLKDLMKQKKSKAFYAKRLGISITEVDTLLDQLKNGRSSDTEQRFTEDIKQGTAETSFRTYKEIHNLDELITEAKIDTDTWDIVKYVQNYWGNGNNPYYQVKAWLERKKPLQSDIIDKILNNYKSSYKPLKTSDLLLNKKKRKTCAVISLADFHLDKLTIDNESIETKIKYYKEALLELLELSYSSFLLEEIVFVIGNDYFHTDTIHGTTTSGTPVYPCIEWENAYEIGFNLMVEAIQMLKQFCKKLNIILVQGNHPRTKEYYLAHALETYFRIDKSIVFNRSSEIYKTFKYGNTLLCFNHGNNVNDKLPLVFATEFYKEWGECRYKEIILGDKHHNSEKLFKTQGEANGIRMRIVPALSGTDRWHKDNQFTGSIRAGLSLIYDYEKGKCGEFESRL